MISNFGGQVTPSGSVNLVNGRVADAFLEISSITLFQFGFAIEPYYKTKQSHNFCSTTAPNDNAENMSLGVE